MSTPTPQPHVHRIEQRRAAPPRDRQAFVAGCMFLIANAPAIEDLPELLRRFAGDVERAR